MKKIDFLNKYQEMIERSGSDIVIVTGNAGGGKTFSILKSFAGEIKRDPKFSALILRKNLDDAKAAGSFYDELLEIYPLECEGINDRRRKIGVLVKSGNGSVTFVNGAKIDITHIANESPETFQNRFQGRQYAKIFLDEADKYKFQTVMFLITRNRSMGGSTRKQIYLASNPERECWIRIIEGKQYGGGWVGDDGYVIEEMQGVVRYVYFPDSTPQSGIWGSTKEEVYMKAQAYIEPKVQAAVRRGLKMKGTDFVLSVTHVEPSVYDNTILLKQNPDYIAKLASSSAGASMLDANHNHSRLDLVASEEGISADMIEDLFKAPPGDYSGEFHVVSDLAKMGQNNMTVLSASGLYVSEMDFYPQVKTTFEQAVILRDACAKGGHAGDNGCIVFDAGGGHDSIGEMMPGARGFISLNTVVGGTRQKKTYYRLKDQCAYQLYRLIKGEIPGKRLYINPKLALKAYPRNMKRGGKFVAEYNNTLKDELREEVALLQFDYDVQGKLKLGTKESMKDALGGGRSTDVLDILIMLMWPQLGSLFDDLEKYENNVAETFQNNTSVSMNDYIMMNIL